MNLRSLRTLVEISHVGGFARAAERLGLTLSAVSNQMKTLEDELQVDLFDRTHRPPVITPAARLVVEHARVILGEVNEIRAIADEPDGLHGSYRLGLVATAVVRFVPGFLARAQARAPHARFSVETGLSVELMARLRAGALDAAVLTHTVDMEGDMRLVTLSVEPFVLATPKGAKSTTLQACVKTMPFIAFTATSGIGALAEEYVRKHASVPVTLVALDSVEAVMECVNAGVGFALLPEPDARRYGDNADLHRLGQYPLSRNLSLAAPVSSPTARQLDALEGLFRI